MTAPSLCTTAESWVSQSLDSSPVPDAIREHLENCSHCKPRLQHWQILTASLASLPRTPVPQLLRKRSLSQLLRASSDRESEKERRIFSMPWYVRAPLEGMTVVALLLGIVTAVPRIKRWYDQDSDRGLSDLSELVTPQEPTAPKPLALEANDSQVAATRDDFSGEGEDEESEAPELDPETESIASAAETAYVLSDSGEKIRVGKSDIWRFMIKSDSPNELRAKITDLLRSLGLPKDAPEIAGITAPGGIQFDLFLAPHLVPKIKQDLERIATPKNRSESSPQDSFSWYKSRSRQKIPDRQVRVVIWISQV